MLDLSWAGPVAGLVLVLPLVLCPGLGLGLGLSWSCLYSWILGCAWSWACPGPAFGSGPWAGAEIQDAKVKAENAWYPPLDEALVFLNNFKWDGELDWFLVMCWTCFWNRWWGVAGDGRQREGWER